jgi:hypothetical protein
MFLNQGEENEPFRYTEAEAAMIARIAEVKVAADSGDRKAKKQIAKVLKQLAALQKRARRGDKRAARAAQVLEESGILAPSQTFAMEGFGSANPWTWQVGNVNVLPIALGLTAGVLAYMRKWGLAAVPVVVWGLHEARQKKWI